MYNIIKDGMKYKLKMKYCAGETLINRNFLSNDFQCISQKDILNNIPTYFINFVLQKKHCISYYIFKFVLHIKFTSFINYSEGKYGYIYVARKYHSITKRSSQNSTTLILILFKSSTLIRFLELASTFHW